MATVTVGCKWGPGLNIRIGAFHEITVTDRFGGFRQEKQWRPEKTIAIKGPNQKGAIQTQDGYALTHGVDADEFALWLNLSADAYWTRQGRESIDAVILFGALLAIGARGAPLFTKPKATTTKPN